MKRNLTLAEYLTRRGHQICQDNGCTEDNHKCDSYAYITADYKLLDICLPDYFAGSNDPVAAIPLPWTGSMKELKAQVDEDIGEEE